MYIELNPDGSVLNTFENNDPDRRGEWYPDDTALIQESPDGDRYAPTLPLRISRRLQKPDWPARAARAHNASNGRWESTGRPTQETDLEKSIAVIRTGWPPRFGSLTEAYNNCDHLRNVVLALLAHTDPRGRE